MKYKKSYDFNLLDKYEKNEVKTIYEYDEFFNSRYLHEIHDKYYLCGEFDEEYYLIFDTLLDAMKYLVFELLVEKKIYQKKIELFDDALNNNTLEDQLLENAKKELQKKLNIIEETNEQI